MNLGSMHTYVDLNGALVAPTSVLNATSWKGPAIFPLGNHPRSPPFLPDGHSEYSAATWIVSKSEHSKDKDNWLEKYYCPNFNNYKKFETKYSQVARGHVRRTSRHMTKCWDKVVRIKKGKTMPISPVTRQHAVV